MDEDPGNRSAMSLHLSRVLDEVGLNTLTVRRRRHAFLCREQMINVQSRLIERHLTVYHFGSQTEGATTLGMHSDIDTLICKNDINVIEDWADWQQGKINMLMLHEDTAPGYCRLQELRPDEPMAREDLPDEHTTYDSSGRVILKNTAIHSKMGKVFHGRSGPATSDSSGSLDLDYVIALHCKKWPEQAAEFTRRRRRHGWPPQRLLEEAISHGVFLVPVGHKLSLTEPLEWRISASMAERCLMFSLTNVHIKCYTVLKMFIKTFITPEIKESISSYHCKTALLHCTETTEPGFWREDNLLQCVKCCLDVLRNWVTDLFCPQFMIRGENLFAGKVTISNRELLIYLITKLIRSDECTLLHVQMDTLGDKLLPRLNTKPSCVSVVDSAASVALRGEFECYLHIFSDISIISLIIYIENNANQTPVIHSVYEKICLLSGMVEHANKQEREVIQAFIPRLSCWLGSLLASLSLSHNRRVPRQAVQLMSAAAKNDVASMLKLASVFYCRGKFGKVETMLQIMEDRFRKHDMHVCCGCYEKPFSIQAEFCQMMYVLKGKRSRAKLFVHCVRFSAHEVYCAPRALRHELYKAVGDDLQHRHPVSDKWMALAAVDCLPFLYYLQYLTYKQMGKCDLQQRSLRNLDLCVREDHDFYHLETAWSLLGQCREDKQDIDAAMTCYKVSLEIRARNNAANWHVASLVYKMIRNRGLLQGVAGDHTEK